MFFHPEVLVAKVHFLRTKLLWTPAPSLNYNDITTNSRVKLLLHTSVCPPWYKRINNNYINICLENYVCCRVTITVALLTSLQIIYVIISRIMVFKTRFFTLQNMYFREGGKTLGGTKGIIMQGLGGWLAVCIPLPFYFI